MHASVNKIVLALFLWMTYFSLLVRTEGVFQLRLKQFNNSERHDATGSCCVSSNHDPQLCTGPCQTAFRVCLKHFQAKVDPGPPCYYGSIETPVIGEDTFSPMAVSFFGNSPIEFKFNFSWPGYFSLIVDVFHKKKNQTERQIYNVASTQVLISRLVKSGFELPKENRFFHWTTPKPYRHRNSVLQYSYRVLCLKNTYGADCSTYCRPRNDGLGHYNCDKNGKKICLPGWTSSKQDTYCTKAICREGCFHGICTRPNICRCNFGWTGNDCSRCITRTGCVHGTCTGPLQCKCKVGWGGHYCNQDLNFCTNNSPCQNGALCSNTGQGSYTCTCAPGFIGRNCHLTVDACISLPCRNNQLCENLIDNDQCICSKFLGRSCNESARMKCSDFPCRHGGTCKTLSNGFKCFCKSGFSGSLCENESRQCTEQRCLNGGVCLDPPDVHRTCHCRRCRCAISYSGDKCQYTSGYVTTTVPLVWPASNDEMRKIDLPTREKHEHKERYLIQETAETQIIILDDQSRSVNKTHWIAICLSTGILVVSLLLATACLIHHRKKITLSKHTTNLKQHSSTDLQHPNEMDVSSTTNHSLQVSESSKDGCSCNSNLMTVSPKVKRFLKHEFNTTAPSWEENDKANYSEMQLSSNNGLLMNNQPAKGSFSLHSKRDLVFNSLVKQKEVNSTAQHNDVPIGKKMTQLQETTFSEVAPFVEHPSDDEHPRCPLMRPPTYEEVCEENNVLLA